MISDIYHIEGQYPDPEELEVQLKKLESDPLGDRYFKEALLEVKEAGMDSHPLLQRFFVES
jgi:hypothetical protein